MANPSAGRCCPRVAELSGEGTRSLPRAQAHGFRSPVRLRRQELDLVGDDLERVAPDTVLTSRTAAVEAHANVDEPALGDVLSGDLSEAAPSDDVVELQLVSPVVDDPEGRDGGAVGRFG
jgi:hypothetical protein